MKPPGFLGLWRFGKVFLTADNPPSFPKAHGGVLHYQGLEVDEVPPFLEAPTRVAMGGPWVSVPHLLDQDTGGFFALSRVRGCGGQKIGSLGIRQKK